MTSTEKVAQIILLHPDDNILVCISHIHAGDLIDIDGQRLFMAKDIDIGHKLARRALNIGDKVYRYGAPIGSMTQAVACGEHVHMHNLRSDYIPSHTRTREPKDRSES